MSKFSRVAALEREPGGRVAAAARERRLLDPDDAATPLRRAPSTSAADLRHDRRHRRRRRRLHGRSARPGGRSRSACRSTTSAACRGSSTSSSVSSTCLPNSSLRANGIASGRIGAPVAPRIAHACAHERELVELGRGELLEPGELEDRNAALGEQIGVDRAPVVGRLGGITLERDVVGADHDRARLGEERRAFEVEARRRRQILADVRPARSSARCGPGRRRPAAARRPCRVQAASRSARPIAYGCPADRRPRARPATSSSTPRATIGGCSVAPRDRPVAAAEVLGAR